MKSRLLLMIFAATASLASADVIVAYTAGSDGTVTEWVGESFTTPVGGPWTDIAFNFYSDIPAATPAAAGDAFLLTQEYLGTPSALSSSTPGFLAESTGNSGGVYTFAPGVVVNASTQYWLYEDTSVTVSGSSTAGGPSGQAYFATSAATDFAASGTQLANFTLSGSVDPAPEPSTLFSTFAGAGLLAGIALLKRRRSSMTFGRG
jgi:hypothetical protein